MEISYREFIKLNKAKLNSHVLTLTQLTEAGYRYLLGWSNLSAEDASRVLLEYAIATKSPLYYIYGKGTITKPYSFLAKNSAKIDWLVAYLWPKEYDNFNLELSSQKDKEFALAGFLAKKYRSKKITRKAILSLLRPLTKGK